MNVRLIRPGQQNRADGSKARIHGAPLPLRFPSPPPFVWAANGAADVSKVLAAIQWVVSFRERYGIRVLNLSFTGQNHPALADAVSYARTRNVAIWPRVTARPGP